MKVTRTRQAKPIEEKQPRPTASIEEPRARPTEPKMDLSESGKSQPAQQKEKGTKVRSSRLKTPVRSARLDPPNTSSVVKSPAAKPKPQVSLGARASDGTAEQPVAKALDKNKLLQSTDPDALPIAPEYLQWYLNQGTLMQAIDGLEGKDAETQKKLALVMLHGYSKAATVGAESAAHLGIQASPLLQDASRYYRSTTQNTLVLRATIAIAKDLGIPVGSLLMVDNPKFAESIARQFPVDGIATEVESRASFERSVDQVLDKILRGNALEDWVVFDYTKLLANDPKALKDVRDTHYATLEGVVVDKLTAFLTNNAVPDPNAVIDAVMKSFAAVAFTTHKGQNLLLQVPFLVPSSPNLANLRNGDLPPTGVRKLVLDRLCDDPNNVGETKDFRFKVDPGLMTKLILHTGYRPDPMATESAWLGVASPRDIMGQLKLPVTELATKGKAIPTVVRDFSTFAKQPVVEKFGALSDERGAAPYVKSLAGATQKLLAGLSNASVDKAFADKGLTQLLQLSYFRMMNAMQEGSLRKDDQVAFLNQIELVHQEILSILAIAAPYKDRDFADVMKATLATGPTPVVPVELGQPRVNLKPSAMHCVSSIMGSVEAQKGSNQVNACILKDNYYESAFALGDHAKTYRTSVLDGDKLRDPDTGDPVPLDPVMLGGKTPLDLFICDFHHNISLDRTDYHPENLIYQVDQLFANKLVAPKFTVAIDCTIDLIQSADVRAFLAHNKDRIANGDLNVVVYRSAQKFDMLGMDNYYGGYSYSVNHDTSYANFNTRMDAPEDQMTGLNRQGLTHLNKYAGPALDAYRQALIDNTRSLYDQLPAAAIYHQGTTNPMQISRIDDDKAVFLDLKFPNSPKTGDAVKEALKRFAASESLPFTTRPSFGFPTTNFTEIQGGLQTRLNPGLDSPATLARYAAFFKATQASIESTVSNNPGLSAEELDEKIARNLKSLVVPKT